MRNHGALTDTVAFAKAQANAAVRTLRTAIIERRYGDAPLPVATASMLLPHLFVEACDSAAAEDLWIDGLLDLATLIVPESTPSELEPVWARIAEAKCYSRRSANQKQWLTLVRAVSNRDAPAMITASEKILADAKAFKPSARMQYALRAATLGNLLAGDRGNTTLLWQAYGASAFREPEPPLDVRMMIDARRARRVQGVAHAVRGPYPGYCREIAEASFSRSRTPRATSTAVRRGARLRVKNSHIEASMVTRPGRVRCVSCKSVSDELIDS